MALDEQPEPQTCFKDRVKRAKQFVKRYNPPYPVYIDGWNNQFADTFRAWPDKYHCVNSDLNVYAKAEYHSKNSNGKEAVVKQDYTVLLENLLSQGF